MTAITVNGVGVDEEDGDIIDDEEEEKEGF